MNEKDEVVVPVVEIDPITAKDEEIVRLSEERDNYKAVALKRLGKLPGDAEFLDKDGSGELSIAEQVRIALLDREIESVQKAKDTETSKIIKENAELRLALKNRPGVSLGGGSGDGVEVKDNILSEQQIIKIRATAERLKVKDVDAYVEKAKRNLLKNSR